MNPSKKWVSSTATLGLVLNVMGVVIIASFPNVFDAIFRKFMVVTPDSYSYSIWKEDLPVPLYMKIYFFNVTNSAEIKAKRNVKPSLVQLGPYTFQEHHQKVDEQWNECGTVTYQQKKTWVFVPKLSVGSMDDELTTVNIIAAAATEYARHQADGAFYTQMMDSLFEMVGADLFLTYPVRNFTFDGISDEILTATSTFPGFIVFPISFDKFGWFYERNGSKDYDGFFTMFTGTNDFDRVGQISEWNFETRAKPNIYPGNCGIYKGSAGDFFPPHLQPTSIDFFSSDICRSIQFKYNNTMNVNGVEGYKYVLDAALVVNSSVRSDHACYNPYPDPNEPLYTGLLNVSSCKFNAPAYVSYPHFYLADAILAKQFADETFNSQQELHESFLILEPLSGIPLAVAVRLQINILVRPLTRLSVVDNVSHSVNVTLFNDLTPTYYPMIWFEVVTELNDGLMASLVKLISMAPYIGTGTGITLIIAGISLVSSAIYLQVRP